MDPVLFARANAVALDVCRQVAAIGLPWDEVLTEAEREMDEAPTLEQREQHQAVALVLAVIAECAEIGGAIAVAPPAVTVAEPEKGPVVAQPGGLRG